MLIKVLSSRPRETHDEIWRILPKIRQFEAGDIYVTLFKSYLNLERGREGQRVRTRHLTLDTLLQFVSGRSRMYKGVVSINVSK